MNKTILQVPLSQQMKLDAERAASAQGFSSLQEAVRVFLNKLANGSIQVSFGDTIQLSKKASSRYSKILSDIAKDKDIYDAENVDDLMEKLHNAS